MEHSLLLRVALSTAISLLTVQAQPPLSTEELDKIAVDAYVYTYPLVVMDVTRRSMRLPVSLAGIGPTNEFNHLREFPKSTFKAVVRPNFDTLYSSAWVDLTHEPRILSIPETGERYFILQMMDMWTEVFAAPSARTVGGKGARFVIAPPKWTGALPEGIEKIEAPTPYIWIIGRTRATGEDDFSTVNKIQDGYTLTPLSEWNTTAETDKPDKSQNDYVEPPGKAENMTAQDYFTYAAHLLQFHPPHATDAEILERVEQIGLAPDAEFDFMQLEPTVQQALERAPETALKLMTEAEPKASRIVNGWRLNIETMGVYGNDYLKRAIVAKTALGANVPEDAVYPMAFVDGDGNPLTGEHRYIVHFNEGHLPPVHAFWSITLYNAEGFPVDNKLNRYAIGDHDPLLYNQDGSLDILIQHENPGAKMESNWLPAPEKDFNLTMRLYWPKKEVLDATWAPPPVQRIDSK